MSENPPEKRILVTEDNLNNLGIPRERMRIILQKIGELVRDGKIKSIEKAREVAPTIDISNFKEPEPLSRKPETPWQLKKQGKR